MKKIILLQVLSLLTLGGYAQSLEELKSKQKTTASERIRKSPNYRAYSNSWDVDEDTWGLGYNYSSAFPLAISANYTTSYFYIGGEFGANFKKEQYIIKETQHEKKIGDPICYLSVNPGLYLKYISISCGVGLLFDSRDEATSYSSSNSDIFENGPVSGSTSIEVSSSTSMTTTGVSLFVKPSLTGYIPISDGDWYITLSAGYNICPKFKDLNGFTFGAGFQVEL